MIFSGIPNLHIQLSQNNYATSAALHVDLQGTNRTKRENLSTIVKIASKPRAVVGRGIIKSIVTCKNGLSGFSRGYKSPPGDYVDTFYY